MFERLLQNKIIIINIIVENKVDKEFKKLELFGKSTLT